MYSVRTFHDALRNTGETHLRTELVALIVRERYARCSLHAVRAFRN